MYKPDLSETSSRIFPKILRMQAQQNGDTDFLVNEDMRVTFAEAEKITNQLATGLASLGLKRGDRLGLYMGNRPEFVLLSLAANKLGAVWVPINTDYKGEWLLDSVRRSRCTVMVTDTEFQERLLPLRAELDIPQWVVVTDSMEELDGSTTAYQKLLGSTELESEYLDQHYGDTCAILWTSGTTGKSKGVLQNYNGWIRAIFQGASILFDTQKGDVIYCAMPLFNTGAWITAIYRALLEGIPCVIEPRFSVTQFWERVALFKATQTFLIGAMGVFLWNQAETSDDAKTTLRKAMMVPFPPDLWSAFEKRFNLEICRVGLGQSESQLITTQLEARDDVPVYSLGFPPPDVELKLCDDEGNEVTVGEPGEICIRPLEEHLIFNGYFDNEEATQAAFRGEWYLTGDMARQDATTGAYFFVDRKKDAVRYGGRNISTLEVESVFRRYPAVADVAAFGIPSEEVESEHQLKVNVVLKPDEKVSAEEICSFINDHAPYYFVPRYLSFVDELPYTPTNKVQKYKLRDQGVDASTWDLKQSGFQVRK
ncbi:MAG: AMP-binding protein [Pseudomonadales bacterium]